ncbi:GAF domain-containing sensor histidine kinase [Aeromicrobium wangtongii]|uniref:GAF domain-containing protein n=1 Tax=Aeromicrobium wangtongii TaxID=2969247 RepID=A0ABY5M5S1_9ACTN|nr:GAF domain-containing sensor histidine kinase [Aeromicrobium wangtongii]MCD9197999.1 GAF domain-containing protein [Aeromicrobium wangtongii]UUP12043.1 GAF domain-containing protein [Aeromicrobium wangtongii]
MRDLIRIHHELTDNLDTPRILQTIAELGKELLEARYAAIGILDDEHRIKALIHTGMDDDGVELMGTMPQGKDLLGALIDTLRLDAAEGDPDGSVGFPAHHPWKSFLGVPIRVQDVFYGTLLIADSERGAFSDADEEMAEALAATAGIALQNARQLDASNRRAKWSAALADLARRPIEIDDEGNLCRIVEEVRQQSSADLAFLAKIAATGEVIVERAAGSATEDLSDVSFPLDAAALAAVVTAGVPVLLDRLVPPEPGGLAVPALSGPTMIVTYPRHGAAVGALVVCRDAGKEFFDAQDIEMGVEFAALINEMSRRRELLQTRQRVAVLEDRGRIARDLHDHVIQSLFATGLNLEEIAAMVPADAAARIGSEIDSIDSTITQIRQSIFELRREPRPGAVNLRTRILQIVDHVTGASPGTTQLVLSGPVDTLITGTCRDDVAAVVTEGLINVVKHAEASKVDVAVTAMDGTVNVEVTDDGRGPGEAAEVSGLLNLRRRAESRGGTFKLHGPPAGGTKLTWSVPL